MKNSFDLAVVFGDQLTEALTSLTETSPSDTIVLMAEVAEEATYVRHHKHKLGFFFAAMRQFADRLRNRGWTVDYVALEDPDNLGSLRDEIRRAANEYEVHRVILTEPGEWRLLEMAKALESELGIPVEILEDNRFICSHDEFSAWSEGRKQVRMEDFYRKMRRKTGLLMDGKDPAGGQWNYDRENRESLPKDVLAPSPRRFAPDEATRAVLDLVSARFAEHMGHIENFGLAVNAAQADEALEAFLSEALPFFGDYQDAMRSGDFFLFHSALAVYLNVGFLDPLEVCRRAEAQYRTGRVPLNAAEGFIRQVIGWREYVRGLYWRNMPKFADSNYFEHDAPLPDFYWTGDTEMACLRAAISQTIETAYAHHIQRLMITGNYALLSGVSPKAVHEWYLSVYADAIEWVELPNTLGMSQYADGGLLGSKPYVSGGNYINKMSDYCADCAYSVGDKSGPTACPFNYLYWDFLDRHRDKLDQNPRLRLAYKTLDGFSKNRRIGIQNDAERHRRTLTQ